MLISKVINNPSTGYQRLVHIVINDLLTVVAESHVCVAQPSLGLFDRRFLKKSFAKTYVCKHRFDWVSCVAQPSLVPESHFFTHQRWGGRKTISAFSCLTSPTGLTGLTSLTANSQTTACSIPTKKYSAFLPSSVASQLYAVTSGK